MPRSFSERGFCRVGELMGVFGAEWGILGKVGRPVAWAQARVSCSWRLRRTEDCRRCRGGSDCRRRLGPCQRFIVACVRSSRSRCSTTKRSGASSGFGGRPRQPRQARPSIRPHFRGARKRLIPVVDLNDGRRQNRGEQSRQKEEDHRHRQNRRQRCGFFLSHGHS